MDGGAQVAKFNPAEAIPEDSEARQVKFNPAEAIPEEQATNQGPYIPISSTIPIEAFKGIAKGIGSDVANIGNLLTGGKIPKYNPSGPGVNVGKLAPAFALGPLGEGLASIGIESAASASPLIDSLASSKVGGALTRLLPSAAGGAASSLGGDNPLKDAGEGALIGAALPPVLSGIANAYPVAKRGLTKLLVGSGKNVTPEEFEAARATIPEGIKAPIGELAQSPRAKNLYERTRSIAGSFAEKPYNQIYDYLNQGSKSLIEGAPKTESPNQFIYDDLVKKYEGLKSNTKDAYSDLANYADKKIPFNRDSYDSYLDSTLENIKREMQRGPTAVDENLENLKQLQNLKEDKIENFSDAQKQKSSIRKLVDDLSSGANRDKKRFDAGLLLGAKDALEQSMKDSASLDPVSFEKYQKANNARIEQGKMERLNLRDKTPFFKEYDKKETSPSNIIGSYFKTGKYQDASKLLSNLTDNLSPDSKKVLADYLISPSGNESVAKKLSTISKLTPGQRNLIFGEDAQKAEGLSNLANIYTKGKSADFTPETGWTGSKGTQSAIELSGALGSLLTGHPSGALVAYSPSLIAQATQRALRSDALKNEYLNYLRGLPAAPNRVSPLINRAAITALAAPRGGNGS